MSESWPHPRLYWTADRTALVEEGDPRAAFLAYSGFVPLDPAHEPLVKRFHQPVADKAVRAHVTKSTRR